MYSRKALVEAWAKQEGVSAQSLLERLSQGEIRRVREMEKGVLYHYHTMLTDDLIRAAAEGELKSMDTQLAEGKTFPPGTGSGARPDVVLFTRDCYNKEGALWKPGIGEAIKLNANRSILVFGPEIMDLPGYDITDVYPAIPSIRLNSGLVKACLNLNPAVVAPSLAVLLQGNPGMKITTAEDWKSQLGTVQAE